MVYLLGAGVTHWSDYFSTNLKIEGYHPTRLTRYLTISRKIKLNNWTKSSLSLDWPIVLPVLSAISPERLESMSLGTSRAS